MTYWEVAQARRRELYDASRPTETGMVWGNGRSWTEGDDAVLTRMWTEGHSSTAISDILKTRTRNSVIGRLKRLGLLGIKLEGRAWPKIAIVREPRVQKVRRPKPKPVPVIPEPIPIVIPNLKPVRFLARRQGQCAWPLWGDRTALDDKTCCGAPCRLDGPQNCSFHAGVAYGRSLNGFGEGRG